MSAPRWCPCGCNADRACSCATRCQRPSHTARWSPAAFEAAVATRAAATDGTYYRATTHGARCTECQDAAVKAEARAEVAGTMAARWIIKDERGTRHVARVEHRAALLALDAAAQAAEDRGTDRAEAER